jgi:hypothetical protein
LTNGIKTGYTSYVQPFPCGSNSVVECLVANENVASSSLVSRFTQKGRFRLETAFLLFCAHSVALLKSTSIPTRRQPNPC